MKKMFFISAVILVFIACSHKITSSTPTSSTGKPKVDAGVMYISDIKPIIEAKCSPCHLPAMGGFKASFEDFALASKNIDDMIFRVQLAPADPKYMPFKGKKEALTSAEIASFKAWKEALSQQ